MIESAPFTSPFNLTRLPQRSHRRPQIRGKPQLLPRQPQKAQEAPPASRPSQESDDDDLFDEVPEPVVLPKRTGGRRMVPVHQSRIADRPAKVGEKDSSLKIKIELDLEVEVEIYARVKGDVTIGLM